MLSYSSIPRASCKRPSKLWGLLSLLTILSACLIVWSSSQLFAAELSITTNFTYNANDAVETITTNDGVVSTLAYDVVDRLTGISYSNGETGVQMVYSDLDQLLSITDSTTGTTNFIYDPRFYGLVQTAYPNGQKVKYEYNNFGELTNSYVDGYQGDRYSYDAEGRVVQIFAEHGTTSFSYNPTTGRLDRVQLGNGITEEYTYLPVTGELGSMTQRQVNGDPIAEFTYTYYLNGLKKTVTELTPEGGTKIITYSYDNLLRLSSASYQLESGQVRVESYEYDPNGNRLRRLVTLDGNTQEDTAYRYNGLNQIVQAGDEVIFHDSKGNISRRVSLIDDIETNYTWDNNNRLLVVEKKDGTQILKTVTYVYNGLGQRVSRTLVKDGQAPVVSNYTNNTGALYSPMGIDVDGEFTEYLGGGASKKNGRVRYQLGGIGGVGRIIDELGKVVVTYDYDAFGRILPESHVTGEVDDPKERANVFRYSGEQYDEETGLIFLRNRYYDPNLGRFLSLDAHPGYMTNPQTLNPYVYCTNDPVNYEDPLGLCNDVKKIRIIKIGFPGAGPQEDKGGQSSNEAFMRGLKDHHPSAIIIPKTKTRKALKHILAVRKEGPVKIQLYGYSLGGIAAIRLAKRLDKLGIDVDFLGLIDPVNIFGKTVTVPSNVKSGENHYQRGKRRWPTPDFHGDPVKGNDNVKNIFYRDTEKIDGFDVKHQNMPVIVLP